MENCPLTVKAESCVCIGTQGRMQRNITLMSYVTKCNIKGERVAMAFWRHMASQGQCVQVGTWWHWSRDSGRGGTWWWCWRGLVVHRWEAAPL